MLCDHKDIAAYYRKVKIAVHLDFLEENSFSTCYLITYVYNGDTF